MIGNVQDLIAESSQNIQISDNLLVSHQIMSFYWVLMAALPG
jgi:hypothetical protein